MVLLSLEAPSNIFGWRRHYKCNQLFFYYYYSYWLFYTFRSIYLFLQTYLQVTMDPKIFQFRLSGSRNNRKRTVLVSVWIIVIDPLLPDMFQQDVQSAIKIPCHVIHVFRGRSRVSKKEGHIAKGEGHIAKWEGHMAKGEVHMAKGEVPIAKWEGHMAKGEGHIGLTNFFEWWKWWKRSLAKVSFK